MEYIRAARYDLMKTDAIRLMLFAVLMCGLIWGYLKVGARHKSVLVAGVVVLMLVDLLSVGNQFLQKDHLANMQKLRQVHFAKSDADRFLLKDQLLYCVELVVSG